MKPINSNKKRVLIELMYLVKRMLIWLRMKHILNDSAVRIQDARRLIDGDEVGVGRRGVGSGGGHNVL